MSKTRLEAFNDAVIAIIMTILVLELKPVTDLSWHGLWDIRTELLSYLFSFFLMAVTWNNHHHMFQVIGKINGAILWANTNLLLWLSLFPFATTIVDSHWMSPFAEQLYVLLYFLYNIAWLILRLLLVKQNPKSKQILGHKDLITCGITIMIFILTFLYPPLGVIGCFLNTLQWVIPYRKVERKFSH
jgi:uncharacterized membrane protein